MYGSVFRLRPKAGQEQALIDMLGAWEKERRPNVPGVVAGYLYKLDSEPRTYINAVVFTDREAYRRNADDPAQDAWYQKLRALLEADPEWNDGEIVNAF